MSIIVILEDDKQLACNLIADLEFNLLPRIGMKPSDIVIVTSEYEFQRQLPKLVEQNPVAFIIDLMVRWVEPSPTIPKPPREVIEQGYYQAGLRCIRELRRLLPEVPVWIYSVLDEESFPVDLNFAGSSVYRLSKQVEATELASQILDALTPH